MEQNLEPIRKTSGTGIYQVLRYALSFGAGVRQFSRLTGVSFGVVQKLKNDHFSTCPHGYLIQCHFTFHSNLII